VSATDSATTDLKSAATGKKRGPLSTVIEYRKIVGVLLVKNIPLLTQLKLLSQHDIQLVTCGQHKYAGMQAMK